MAALFFLFVRNASNWQQNPHLRQRQSISAAKSANKFSQAPSNTSKSIVQANPSASASPAAAS
jgi:hypothetical protein